MMSGVDGIDRVRAALRLLSGLGLEMLVGELAARLSPVAVQSQARGIELQQELEASCHVRPIHGLIGERATQKIVHQRGIGEELLDCHDSHGRDAINPGAVRPSLRAKSARSWWQQTP